MVREVGRWFLERSECLHHRSYAGYQDPASHEFVTETCTHLCRDSVVAHHGVPKTVGLQGSRGCSDLKEWMLFPVQGSVSRWGSSRADGSRMHPV